MTFPPRTDQTTLLPWPMETLSQVPMDHVTNAYMVELKNWMGGMGPPFLPQMQLPPWPPSLMLGRTHGTSCLRQVIQWTMEH